MQLCLHNDHQHLDPSYSQQQLADALGISQALGSLRKSESKTVQLSPIGSAPKRAKRSDAFEVQHTDLLQVIFNAWVNNNNRAPFFFTQSTDFFFKFNFALCIDIQQLGKPHAFSFEMFEEKRGSYETGRLGRGGIHYMPIRQMPGNLLFFVPFQLALNT